MGNNVRVGLAGFGTGGKIFHAPFIHADPRFELRKCYERKTDRCREEYPYVRTVRDFTDLLTDDIDLVIIALPNPLHVSLAKMAIEAGKHVLLEKPAATYSSEAAMLSQLARKRNVHLIINQNRRFDGDFLTVKRILDSGCLGKIVDYRCNYERFVKGPVVKPWKAAGGKGIDILYDLGIHILDQAWCLFGMPESVYAHLRTLRPESAGCDAFDLCLYYPGDLNVYLSATETAMIRGPHYSVNGSEGSFVKYGMDVQEEALRLGGRPPGKHWGEDSPENYGTLKILRNQTSVETRVPTEKGDYGKVYDNIYEVLTQNAKPFVLPEEPATVLRILEAAQRSHALRRRIDL